MSDYDVFISYRWISPDQEWVREGLVPALKAAGLRTLLDVEDFVPGRDLVQEMARAGQSSRTALCVFTPDYFEGNRMTSFEASIARSRDPAGRNSMLIPLILRRTDLPDWVKGLVAVDWTNPHVHAREWTRLLRVLNAPKPDAAAPPPLPTPPSHAAEAADRSGSQHGERSRPSPAGATTARTAPPPVSWTPSLIFIRVNPRVLKPYARYVGVLLTASLAALQLPGLWERLPFLMDHVSKAALQKATPALVTSATASAVGIVLLLTIVTGLLNAVILFSSVKMVFLLALFSFLCAVVTVVAHGSMLPHMMLVLLLGVAFTRHFLMGSLRYYVRRRSFGDAVAESVLLVAFLGLILGPLRAAF